MTKRLAVVTPHSPPESLPAKSKTVEDAAAAEALFGTLQTSGHSAQACCHCVSTVNVLHMCRLYCRCIAAAWHEQEEQIGPCGSPSQTPLLKLMLYGKKRCISEIMPLVPHLSLCLMRVMLTWGRGGGGGEEKNVCAQHMLHTGA